MREIERLIAEISPKPDVPSSIRARQTRRVQGPQGTPQESSAEETLKKDTLIETLPAEHLARPVGTEVVPAQMLTDQLGEEIADTLMIPYPWTGGVIALDVRPRMAGVTFDLVDATAKAYYQEEGTGNPTTDLTATTPDGRGGFVEVSPGEYEIEFGGTAATCTARFGWPVDAANRIRVPVKIGYMTYGRMDSCDAL